MKKYLVISLLEGNELYFDTIMAADADTAEAELLRVRGETALILECHDPAWFAQRARGWAGESDEETREAWAETCEYFGRE
jgi:hypothetical protein